MCQPYCYISHFLNLYFTLFYGKKWKNRNRFSLKLFLSNLVEPLCKNWSPKGELRIFLIGDQNGFPWRWKIRPPGFINLQILPQLIKRMKLADIMTILGSIDIIMGEVDRWNDNLFNRDTRHPFLEYFFVSFSSSNSRMYMKRHFNKLTAHISQYRLNWELIYLNLDDFHL